MVVLCFDGKILLICPPIKQSRCFHPVYSIIIKGEEEKRTCQIPNTDHQGANHKLK